VREDWTEGDIDVGDVRVHFYRAGSAGQPGVVLVHGFSDNGLCWSRVARMLESTFDVVMLDARNHGLSQTAAGDLSDLGADIAAVITGLGLDQPVVVGHSVGAAAAAELAARHPGLVSRLVLEDPPWKEGRDESLAVSQQRRDGARDYLASLTTMTDLQIRDLGRSQHPDWGDTDIADWVIAKQQVRSEAADSLGLSSWQDVIGRITCPTLLIHGDPGRGGILTPALAERIAALNGCIATCSIEESGHNIRRENFARFSEVLSAFLTS
jgi:pimeloyl-ACP methyl ester carboxylesterase